MEYFLRLDLVLGDPSQCNLQVVTGLQSVQSVARFFLLSLKSILSYRVQNVHEVERKRMLC